MQAIRDTLANAVWWPSINLAALGEALAYAGEVDAVDQFNNVWQAEGNPNGRVYVPNTSPAVCLDPVNEVMYRKTDGRISNTGWV